MNQLRTREKIVELVVAYKDKLRAAEAAHVIHCEMERKELVPHTKKAFAPVQKMYDEAEALLAKIFKLADNVKL